MVSGNDMSVVSMMKKTVKIVDDIPTTTPSSSGLKNYDVEIDMKKTFTNLHSEQN